MHSSKLGPTTRIPTPAARWSARTWNCRPRPIPTATAAEMAGNATSRLGRHVTVRPLQDKELEAVDAIMRTAFDKHIGVQDAFSGSSYLCRRHAGVALVAEVDGQLAGSAFGSIWGKCGGVGPVSVHPDYWNSGAASALMTAVMEALKAAGVRHVELFTFPMSYKHHRLYEKSGFEQAMLSYCMTLPVKEHQQQIADAATHHTPSSAVVRLTELPEEEVDAALASCRHLCRTLNPDYDISSELRNIRDHGLGDCLLLWGDDSSGTRALAAVAAVHSGNVELSEAKTGTCFMKVAVARDREALEAIIHAAVAYTLEQGCTELDSGVNTACREAYLTAKSLGFTMGIIGINMQTPGLLAPGVATHNKYDSYLLADTR